MNRIILGTLAMAINIQAFAHNDNYNKDVESIKSMTGCYKVTFRNAETFAFSKNYKYHDRFKSGPVLEWIFVDSESPRKLSLQHLLVAGPHIIKHWRQEWTHEETSLYEYQGDFKWTPKDLDPLNVVNQWTQKVYQVDDSPRYECSAPWIRYNKKNYWECTTNAPLPRREYSKRNDYNIMKRTNRHEIISGGHAHDQDNVKILKTKEFQKPLVMEKGLNLYTKVSNSLCNKAKNWWKDHKDYWFHVRNIWDEFYSKREPMKFRKKVDGSTLWQRLFELGDQYKENPNEIEALKKEINTTIKEFLY
ncbi:hypothetical protein OAK75_01575 [Bacteriovoracales bacterium]|nr:hypothetical protein [Bacteriovoracales bacterium]